MLDLNMLPRDAAESAAKRQAWFADDVIELSQLSLPRRPVFGEFLVNQHVIDRFQLFRALQMQDRLPGARLGQCAVALGYVPRAAIEKAHVLFTRSVPLPALGTDPDAELENMETEAFTREPEIEIEVELSA